MMENLHCNIITILSLPPDFTLKVGRLYKTIAFENTKSNKYENLT
jgi:hypothetical protein